MRAGLGGLAIVLVVAGCSVLSSPAVRGPTPPPGAEVVPADEMTLNVSNGTPLPVAVVVNGTLVGTVAQHDGIDGIPAAQLPPLPWSVEVRSPSGRVLVSATIHAGDAWTRNNGDGSAEIHSAAARVDLSCGRIDVWSGFPMGGPVPGPGVPGDCAP